MRPCADGYTRVSIISFGRRTISCTRVICVSVPCLGTLISLVYLFTERTKYGFFTFVLMCQIYTGDMQTT